MQDKSLGLEVLPTKGMLVLELRPHCELEQGLVDIEGESATEIA